MGWWRSSFEIEVAVTANLLVLAAFEEGNEEKESLLARANHKSLFLYCDRWSKRFQRNERFSPPASLTYQSWDSGTLIGIIHTNIYLERKRERRSIPFINIKKEKSRNKLRERKRNTSKQSRTDKSSARNTQEKARWVTGVFRKDTLAKSSTFFV